MLRRRGGAFGWVSTDGLHWDELVIPGTPDGLEMVDVSKGLAIGPDRAAFWVTGEPRPTDGGDQVFWQARAPGD